MKTRVRALVRGAVVSFAAIALAFTVAVTPAEAATPVITGFSPSSGAPGTLVAVTGNGFTAGRCVSRLVQQRRHHVQRDR